MEKTQDSHTAHIPKTILDQDRAADELMRKLREDKDGRSNDAETQDEARVDVSEPHVDEVEARQDEQQERQSQDQPDFETKDSEDDAGSETQEHPVDQTHPAQQTDPWEQRYRTIEGKYRAETAAMREQIGQLQTSLNQALTLLQQHQQTPTTDQTPQRSAHEQQGTDQTVDTDTGFYGLKEDELVDTFGPEVAAAMIRSHRRQQEELHTLREQIGGISQTVRVSQQERLQHAFRETMARDVPNFEDINNDPAFRDYLLDANPFDPAGSSRWETLAAAINSGNFRPAVAMFQEFDAHRKAATPQQQPKPQSQRPMAPNLQPSKTGAPGNAAQDGRTHFTRAQINRLYDDARKGAYRGREAEFQRIEADIATAFAEGRVR